MKVELTVLEIKTNTINRLEIETSRNLSYIYACVLVCHQICSSVVVAN